MLIQIEGRRNVDILTRCDGLLSNWLPHLRVAFPPKKPAERKNVVSALVNQQCEDPRGINLYIRGQRDRGRSGAFRHQGLPHHMRPDIV